MSSDPTGRHATGQPGEALTSTADPDVDTLAYPISPDYVKSWTPVRALCELIANALDEDAHTQVGWTDGTLTITDDGPGIPEEGLILGYSTKTNQQIGQFGEGKKLACLVLARNHQIGAVRCETVGYGFTPTVEPRRLLGGLIPSRSAQGAEVLVYHLARNDRTRGTRITVDCPQAMADEAVGRFRALTEPGYTPPAPPGACVLTGNPGRVWIGGVLVSTVSDLLASYDLPLHDKALQNRDRTVIEAGALRDAVRRILADNEDPQAIDRFAAHVLAGGKLREPEQFFTKVSRPRVRAAWRTWGRTHLPDNTFYTRTGTEEAALSLADMGYTEVTTPGLPSHEQIALMDLLGVEVARARQIRHYDRSWGKTTWAAEKTLTDQQRTLLSDGVDLVRRAIGPFALDRVRVYRDSEEVPCSGGFYTPTTGDVAIHIDSLTNRYNMLRVLIHEAGHRVAHRGGGRWRPTFDYADRSRGFEHTLGDFAALLLGYLADNGPLPDPVDTPPAEPPSRRRSGVDDPAVPASRRALARLLADRLPHALIAGEYKNVADMIASTGVHPDFWRTMTNPRVAGFRASMGRGRAFNYDKAALLAEAVGVYPPVVWLGYNLCEGSLHDRKREQWGQSGPWAKRMRDVVLRACTDLQAIGGAYADQIPDLLGLADGRTAAALDDDRWQEPARALIALERQRLGLDVATPPA